MGKEALAIDDTGDTCPCGKSGYGVYWFAKAYRIKELKKGHSDPGTLCGTCAGERDADRIDAEELSS